MQHATAHAVHGADLNRLAVSATNHWLTGCAIGELAGMVIAISLGWSDAASIALAVGLAYGHLLGDDLGPLAMTTSLITGANQHAPVAEVPRTVSRRMRRVRGGRAIPRSLLALRCEAALRRR